MGTFSVWCVILYFKPLSGLIGIAWVGVGIVAYVIFRKVQGYSLTKTVKSPTLPATLQRRRGLRPAAGAGARHRR